MSLKKLVFLLLVLFVYFLLGNCKKLLRKRRYVAFPEGAAFSAVVCMTSQMGITDGANIFSEGINWGLVYDLPNDTKPLFDFYKPAQQRRSRRDLYGKVEGILTSMGYDGRSCILRSLCEATKYFKPTEDNLINHILGLIFRFPTDPVLSHEPDDHRIYHYASLLGNEDNQKCQNTFQCPLSLIEIALGYYSTHNNFL